MSSWEIPFYVAICSSAILVWFAFLGAWLWQDGNGTAGTAVVIFDLRIKENEKAPRGWQLSYTYEVFCEDHTHLGCGPMDHRGIRLFDRPHIWCVDPNMDNAFFAQVENCLGRWCGLSFRLTV